MEHLITHKNVRLQDVVILDSVAKLVGVKKLETKMTYHFQTLTHVCKTVVKVQITDLYVITKYVPEHQDLRTKYLDHLLLLRENATNQLVKVPLVLTNVLTKQMAHLGVHQIQFPLEKTVLAPLKH